MELYLGSVHKYGGAYWSSYGGSGTYQWRIVFKENSGITETDLEDVMYACMNMIDRYENSYSGIPKEFHPVSAYSFDNKKIERYECELYSDIFAQGILIRYIRCIEYIEYVRDDSRRIYKEITNLRGKKIGNNITILLFDAVDDNAEVHTYFCNYYYDTGREKYRKIGTPYWGEDTCVGAWLRYPHKENTIFNLSPFVRKAGYFFGTIKDDKSEYIGIWNDRVFTEYNVFCKEYVIGKLNSETKIFYKSKLINETFNKGLKIENPIVCDYKIEKGKTLDFDIDWKKLFNLNAQEFIDYYREAVVEKICFLWEKDKKYYLMGWGSSEEVKISFKDTGKAILHFPLGRKENQEFEIQVDVFPEIVINDEYERYFVKFYDYKLKHTEPINISIYDNAGGKISESKVEQIIKSGGYLKGFIDILSGNPVVSVSDCKDYIYKNSSKIAEEITASYPEPDMQEESKFSRELSRVEEYIFTAGFIKDREVAERARIARNKFARGERISIAILGAPGTGKSSIAEMLANYIYGTEGGIGLLELTPSDLKGSYVGKTAGVVYKRLYEASINNQVMFIDEAYDLQKDQFGKEAVSILLPLMTKEKKDEITVEIDGKKQTFRIPPIWFAGYEQSMRKMLSENQGLYRRMVIINLKSPTIEMLCKKLENDSGDDKAAFGFGEEEEKYQDTRKKIVEFFRWGISKEHNEFFGNYAGVSRLLKDSQAAWSDGMSMEEKQKVVLKMIDYQKEEIKRQYKAILASESDVKYEIQDDVEETLDSIRGYDACKHTLENIIDMIMDDSYKSQGVTIPKGMLLVGPPGTGKTRFAKAVAGEIIKRQKNSHEGNNSQVAFIATIGTELNTPKKIETLFDEAEHYDASIIFIDEIDSIGSRRENNANPGLLIQLMKEMDGFDSKSNVFVMAATNAPANLDPALRRPGRFDLQVEIGLPEHQDREKLLVYYLKQLKFLSGDDKLCEEIAESINSSLVNYTAAMIKNLVNEAGILYISTEKILKKDRVEIDSELLRHRRTNGDDLEAMLGQDVKQKFIKDILEVKERLEIGNINENNIKADKFTITENNGYSSVALHEIGHAVISIVLGKKPFEKITIISRGDSLGYVMPHADAITTKKQILDQVKILLGGRAVEEYIYGADNVSVGAMSDIRTATSYVYDMVALYGMDEEIGMVSNLVRNAGYLNSNKSYICSDTQRNKIDIRVTEIIKKCYKESMNYVKELKDEIIQLAEYVYKEETVSGIDFIEKCKNYEKLRCYLK